MRLKIEGIEEVKKALREAREEVLKALDDGVRAAAESIQSDARGRATERTGALRRGIIVQKYHGAKDGVVVYDVGMDPAMTPIFRKIIQNPKGKRKDAYYPIVVEYGTSRIGAKPFLRPARDAGKGKLKRSVESAIKAVIK